MCGIIFIVVYWLINIMRVIAAQQQIRTFSVHLSARAKSLRKLSRKRGLLRPQSKQNIQRRMRALGAVAAAVLVARLLSTLITHTHTHKHILWRNSINIYFHVSRVQSHLTFDNIQRVRVALLRLNRILKSCVYRNKKKTHTHNREM